MQYMIKRKSRIKLPTIKKKGQIVHFDYKDPRSLMRFIGDNGSIAGRERTGLTHKEQKKLAREVKRARHLALLPFTQTL